MLRPWIFLLLAVLLIPLTARAEVVEELYAVTQPVPDHSEAARQRALREGLGQVLVKLTGMSDITSREAVQTFLKQAPSLVTEFGYVELPETWAESAQTDIGVSVQYSAPEVGRFLRRQQLPIWPANRPALLVWLVVEPSDGEQRFLEPRDRPQVMAGLERLRAQRGQPLRWPLYDLEDQLALDVEQAWNLDAEAIHRASERYDAGGWLLIRGYQTSGGDWRGAWLLGLEGDTWLRDNRGESLGDIVDRAANSAVDVVADQYSYVASTAPGELELLVKGVASYEGYTGLTSMLRDLSMVRRVDVREVDGRQLLLTLDIEGERGQLLETLTLNNRLSVSESPQPGGRVRLEWRRE